MSEKSSPMGKDFILFASKASRLMENDKVEQAMTLCEAGVRNFPFYSPGHFVLGLCYESLGKKDEAKNEFERTLVYDPSHSKAMRKLSGIYENSGLSTISNEWLIKESLYNPMDQSLIEILKEKNLYDLTDQKEKAVEENDRIENDAIETSDSEIKTKETSASEPDLEHVEDSVNKEDVPAEEKKADENGLIDDLDPLAENVELGEGHNRDFADKEKTAENDLNQYANTEDDFSTIMDGYFDSEEDDQSEETDEWIEVENLLIDEEESSEPVVAANNEQPDSQIEADSEIQNTRDETELLLEQLSDLGVDDNSEKQATTDSTVINKEGPAEINPLDTLTESEKLLVPELEEDETQADSQQETVLEPLPDVTPEPEFEPLKPSELSSDEEVTIKDLMENPNLVTPTFGEILVSQRKFSEARHIFMELLKREPDNLRFLKKVEFLDKFLAVQKA
ncbi:MAG: hypothetical protein HND50_00565 [Calditrichaeota bacterium]|nr:hypothetical protein [Calditrichota bacterium]